MNATAKAKSGKVNEMEIIQTSENEYLIRNNIDGSLDVMDVNNHTCGEYRGREGFTASDWFDELQMSGTRFRRSESYQRCRGNNGRPNESGEGRNSELSSGVQGTEGVYSPAARANRQGTAEGVQRKVQVINEVESAIKDSKGNVLGFNVDGNIHLNFSRQFMCFCLRY